MCTLLGCSFLNPPRAPPKREPLRPFGTGYPDDIGNVSSIGKTTFLDGKQAKAAGLPEGVANRRRTDASAASDRAYAKLAEAFRRYLDADD